MDVRHTLGKVFAVTVLGGILMASPLWSQAMTSIAGTQGILTTDAAAKTVTVNLVSPEGTAAHGFNFDGYANGAMTVKVPLGWSVTVKLTVDSPYAHSALIVPWDQKNASSFTPAFPGAATPDFKVGFAKGKPAESFTFTADKAGRYALVCGVPGHVAAGMWDEFDVAQDIIVPQVHVNQS